MKNIILIIALIFALSCKAQTPIISLSSEFNTEDLVDGCYLKDTENKFNPYIGTWEWNSGTNHVTIIIEKIESVKYLYEDRYRDYLIGKYKYLENGVEIINTLDFVINSNNVWSNHPTYVNEMLTPMLGNYESDSVTNFTFADYLKNKNEKASFELLDLFEDIDGTITVTKAKLRLWNTEHWNVNGENHRDPEFTIPNNIILIKQ